MYVLSIVQILSYLNLASNFRIFLMADEESQEITSGGGSSENTHGSPETLVHTQVITVEATREKVELLKKNVEAITTRLDNIHKFMLDIGNYYFAFQGVCLAAISNTSFFVCNNTWFLTLLSILSAVPSLASLGFIAHEWIGLMEQLDTHLTEMDAIQNVEEEHARVFVVLKKYYSLLAGYRHSYALRYFMLLIGAIIILSFTAAVAAWPHVMICKNNGGGHFDKKGFN